MKIAIRGTTRRKSDGAMAAPETTTCNQKSDNIRLPYIGEYEQPYTQAISLLIAMETGTDPGCTELVSLEIHNFERR
jgi:hypothetical protein